MYENKFIWSDNWWIDGNEAYFCAGEIGALFYVDMKKCESKLIAYIPECALINYRLYSYCAKHENTIFCIPHKGKSIWCYDLSTFLWEEIKIGNDKPLLICTDLHEERKDWLWLLEIKSHKIFQINIKTKMIEGEYKIPQFDKSFVGEYVFVQNILYCVIGNYIYSINFLTNNVNTYNLPEVKANLYTICYDGADFWLSGYCKEIYVWNPQKGVIRVIKGFPKQFGLYDFKGISSSMLDCSSFFSQDAPFFIHSISLGKYIWYIPFQSNEIIYIDKETYNIYVLEIKEEWENRQSLKNRFLSHKYLVNYVKGNRYIGLYSFKRQRIFEVDTLKLCINTKNYVLTSKTIQSIITNYLKEEKILCETNEVSCDRFLSIIDKNKRYREGNKCNIGKSIFDNLCEKNICNNMNNL